MKHFTEGVAVEAGLYLPTSQDVAFVDSKQVIQLESQLFSQ